MKTLPEVSANDRESFASSFAKSYISNIKYFIKWTLIALLTGIGVGAVGSAFALSVSAAGVFWHTCKWALFLLPVTGLIIVLIYRLAGAYNPRGTNLVISSISSGEEIDIKMAPLIFISTVLTHIGGGSAGREGAALQLGGSLGNFISKLVKLDSKDRNVAVMCGMSACFAAVFGTPLTAAIFCMEFISIGIMYHAALIPCIFAAYTAAAISHHAGVIHEVFPVNTVAPFDIRNAFTAVVMGMLCAVVSVVFCTMLHKSEEMYKKYFKNAYVRVLVAAFIFIILTLIVKTDDYRGGGFLLVEKCMEGGVGVEAFLFKMIFTALLLGGGFKGGEIVPTFTVGAAFGCICSMFLGISPNLGTACGMAACFAGVTNCPISSIFMSIELFGTEGLAYYAVAIAVCFTLSGYYGLYSAQRFPYSKTKAIYINSNYEEFEKK